MTLTPYRKLLTMGKEAIDAALASVRSRSAFAKGALELAQLAERIATIECEINQICAEKDINFGRIIDKLDDLDIAKRREQQLMKIIDELFPVEQPGTGQT
jgi:hypothetical protein